MSGRKLSPKPADDLADAARSIRSRGWSVGSGGSFSVLLARKPVRLCITSAAGNGAEFDETNLLEIDDDAEIIHGFGRPADETLLHLAIYRRRPRARCILFSRSVAGTVLSDKHFVDGGVAIRGYEAQCGLPGVASHEETVTVPIIENSRDYVALSHVLENVLIDQPQLKGFLIRRHGFFTWGETVEDTMAQLEIFEFLFEVLLRSGK
ncbi:MAG: methylthioribulose 1-phosphate dehydratase [Pyrinomonadaceae bacterium]|nr:methylthioribulose 1-phosphate dehydratase [Pyrinomonadaceae bacterium]